jgi:hypothetical protein
VNGPKGKSEEISFTEWARAIEINIMARSCPRDLRCD